MSSKPVQVNVNIHKKLTELSKQRKDNGLHNYTMSSIVAEMTLALYKKEFKS